MNLEIKEKLNSVKDEKYKEFQQRIIPGVDNIIGVKMLEIRKIAKWIMKQDYLNYLKNAKDDSYEEILLQGMVIANSNMTFEQLKLYISQYVAKITNWALCDLFVSALKVTKNYEDEMYVFIQNYLYSDKSYDIRFGVIMLLNYYQNEKYCEAAFAAFDKITSTEYYVQMAIAWAISMYYVNYPEQTMHYLLHNQLDDFTYNKALQKIIESRQVSIEKKKIIKSMKRKKQGR